MRMKGVGWGCRRDKDEQQFRKGADVAKRDAVCLKAPTVTSLQTRFAQRCR
jgi:hypothetical protein